MWILSLIGIRIRLYRTSPSFRLGPQLPVAGGGPFGATGGHARVLEYSTESETWEPLGQTLIAESVVDRFGDSVDLSSYGRTLAVGATGNDENGSIPGHVRVFGYNAESGSWSQRGQALNGVASGDFFGISVALSADGRTVAVGARNDDNGNSAGHVRVFVG